MASFVDRVERLTSARDPRVRHVGDTAEVRRFVEEMAARTRRTIWNLQWGADLASDRAALPLTRRSLRRGHEFRMVLPLRGAQAHPLATTTTPHLRIAPVPMLLMIRDDTEIVFTGPDRTADGSARSWTSTDPAFVAHAVEAFGEVWDRSQHWSEVGLLPPLPPRRLEVAFAMVDGLTDVEIAKTLGVSPRTASSEVRAVVDWLGARNRGHAIGMLAGAATAAPGPRR